VLLCFVRRDLGLFRTHHFIPLLRFVVYLWSCLSKMMLVGTPLLMLLTFLSAFSLLCENCTLHATCGHCSEAQHSSTTSVHTRSQWKNLSIPCSEWLRTGGCSAGGACSAAAPYAESLPWQAEGSYFFRTQRIRLLSTVLYITEGFWSSEDQSNFCFNRCNVQFGRYRCQQ
jgi:hypothetical protein